MALQHLCALATFFSFLIYSIHNRQGSLNEWSAHRKASTETFDGKSPIILLRGTLGAWGSLTCSKFTTRAKQLKVPPGRLVPWIFPSLKIRRPPPGLNPRRSSHEVGTEAAKEYRYNNTISIHKNGTSEASQSQLCKSTGLCRQYHYLFIDYYSYLVKINN
jgi:hypothetical protein